MPAIKVHDLSKEYVIGGRSKPQETFREMLAEAIMSPYRRYRRLTGDVSKEERFFALKEVSFEVAPGELVGIIGENGAGKSTLLKILSGITEPTSGRIELTGRTSSLLEVGTGFHSELTGRENIFLNGALLGMGKEEIRGKFDEIVAFSEVEKFIDTPVKHYSSGMYVRLAFAVAAHLEPEILIVDEVLAVGDARFQRKCLGRMDEIGKEGRTVLFVSHNMIALQSLCRRAIHLEKGQLVRDGDAVSVVSGYQKTSYRSVTEQGWEDPATSPGNDSVRMRRACVRPAAGESPGGITIRTPLALEFEFWNLEPGARLNLSIHLLNEEGVTVFNSAPVGEPIWHGRPFPPGIYRSVCHVPGDLLNDGTYRVLLLVVRDQGIVLYRHKDILVFNVSDSIDRRGDWYGKWEGAVRPMLKWETEYLGEHRV
jgi:lipopolysaccharide transport system ATP-binding protein